MNGVTNIISSGILLITIEESDGLHKHIFIIKINIENELLLLYDSIISSNNLLNFFIFTL